jgi:hypothetical protein
MGVKREKGILRLEGIDSGHIQKLLQARHSGDVYVPECKTGETWANKDMRRLDGWCLKRTYSPLTTIGYEIKCTRADFEGDQKWTKYLAFCHYFYFVCPAGLIRAVDLPPEIGIIWASKEKLHTKHTAERQTPDPEKLNALLIYVLMSRAAIDPVSNIPPIRTRVESVAKYIKEAEENKQLAYMIKGHLRKLVEEARQTNNGIARREAHMKDFADRLKLLGITWDPTTENWREINDIYDEIRMMGKRLDHNTLYDINLMGERLIEFAKDIKTLREQHEDNEAKKVGGA